jgi:BirA family transcriptional regulator, biotin operon repressor / biotin---[acetyl-CoA-carboxylase] ligase
MLGASESAALASTRFGDVRWHESIDSTNREALALARAGAPDGVVVVADHQTAGRGRLDRQWVAPPGSSLLVSVLLRPAIVVDHLQMVTAAVAVAASDACAEVAGFRPRLKWPNDLVVDDRKLAGVLAEALIEGGQPAAVVVGMGLNVNWPSLPPELAETATACNLVAGHDVDRAALLVRFLERLDEHYGTLCEPGGWRGVLLNYRRLCSTLGRMVRVELPGDRAVVGKAVEVTGDGRLLVEDAGALVTVAAGDVVHLRPA